MSKRANGEGSVYRRAEDGRWTGALTYLDDDGHRRRRAVYGRTQKEVRDKLRQGRARVDAGQPVRDASTTLGSWLATWTGQALEVSDRKRATKDQYASLARTHIAPALGHLPLDRLRPSDVEGLIVRMRGAGLSASTLRSAYTVLRAALEVAVRDGLVSRNVAAAVKRPTAERTDAVFLTADDAQRLLVALRGERLEVLFRFMLATGVRRGEALALSWSDVDLDAATVRVHGTLSRTSRGLEVGAPKTERSRRTVPLPRSMVDALRAHRTRQTEERLAMGPAWTGTGFVFCTEVGTPLEPRNVLRAFQTVARRVGLDGATLHTLRHSNASLLLAAGVHTKVVSEALGHSSYAITADVYSHVTPSQAREAADRLDEALDWA